MPPGFIVPIEKLSRKTPVMALSRAGDGEAAASCSGAEKMASNSSTWPRTAIAMNVPMNAPHKTAISMRASVVRLSRKPRASAVFKAESRRAALRFKEN
jgi:hypothetical protein